MGWQRLSCCIKACRSIFGRDTFQSELQFFYGGGGFVIVRGCRSC